MADYAVMPFSDYEDACNAVREKTGGTESIVSGELGAQIRAITGGENLDDELATQDSLIEQIMTALSPKKCKITINVNNPYDEDGIAEYARVYIGSSYYDADYGAEPVEVEVDPETEISFYVDGDPKTQGSAFIMIDDEVVHSGLGAYGYTVTGDLEMVLSVHQQDVVDGSGQFYGVVAITTSEASGGSTDSTFTPTDSGGTTYKSKFADNNVDLQAILDKVNAL